MTNEEIIRMIQNGRNFMKDHRDVEGYMTDQELKKPQPPLCKAPIKEDRISLPVDFSTLKIDNDFLNVINSRVSSRVYTQKNISLTQLSYLLWCTQGVKSIRGKSYATLRTVPCGGARHQFETYLAVNFVDGLEPGLYHYLPMTHELEFLGVKEDLKDFIDVSLCGQTWACKSSVVFYYSMVAYRAEWRYGIHTHRVALIDVGYVSENLYLASTSIGLGSCAIGALEGDIADKAFGLDGEEEFMILAHPVGTISEENKQAEQDFYAFVKEQGL